MKQFEGKLEKRYKPSNQTTKTKVLATFTIPKVLEMAIAMTPVESYTKLALAQFITVFGDVCKENSLELKTEDGVQVKTDILHRMLYEASFNRKAPTKLLEQDQDQEVQVEQGKEEMMTRRDVSSNSSIKINYKDLKKVEKKCKVQFPFMPDLVDYKCENTACQALRVCGNLFIPCGTNVKNWTPGGETLMPTCKTCLKQGNAIRYGCLGDRMDVYTQGQMYEAPEKDDASVSSEEGSKVKGPKKEVTFATYLAKKGDLGSDAKQRNGRLSEKIEQLQGLIRSEFHMDYKFDASHFAIDKTKVRGKKDGQEKKLGRPKKERSASVSSTDEENEPEQVSENVVENAPAEEVSEKKQHALEVVEKMCENVVAETPKKKEQKPKKAKQPKEPKKAKKAKEVAAGEAEVAVEEKKETPKKKEKKEKKVEVVEPAVEHEELVEEDAEQQQEEAQEVATNVKKFTYKDGKEYYYDPEDLTVYNMDDEYVGDITNTETGDIEFIDEDED